MAPKSHTRQKQAGRSSEGRGRLSSIDLLPPECDLDIVWADELLRERKLPQTAILAEFNERLADKRLPPVSKGAWSRYSVRKAKTWRRLDEGRIVMADTLDGIDGGRDNGAGDRITMLIGEMLKLAVFEHLEAGEVSVKDLNGLARVLRHSVNAQADTVAWKKAVADYEERLKQIAALVADSAGKGAAGKDTLAKITELLTTGAG